MFTGIVEELGGVITKRASGDGARLEIEGAVVVRGSRPGDSVAVNGCCLTIVEAGDRSFEVEVVGETLGRTNLAGLSPGDPVNLERPAKLADRLGGHLVQGHVDAVGTVRETEPYLEVTLPSHLLRYVAEKGSITVDGCSLTVVDVLADGFTVAVIPHTAKVTTLGRKGVGSKLNVEVDIIAKYTERLLVEAGVLGPPAGQPER